MKHPIFSACGKYRYTLERKLTGSGPKILFIGINPSFATADEDDNTVKAWTSFANKQNASKFYVANIFNLISPHVSHLRLSEPFGPDRYDHLKGLIAEVDLIIPCWGDRKKLTAQYWTYFDDMKKLLIDSKKQLKCYGYTKVTKDPVHLQRLPRSADIVDFN